MRSAFMDSFVYSVKEKELELKYTSVPNVLFYWTPPIVLHAILQKFSREDPQPAKKRGRPTRVPYATHRAHYTVTCFSKYALYHKMHCRKTPQDPSKQSAP